MAIVLTVCPALKGYTGNVDGYLLNGDYNLFGFGLVVFTGSIIMIGNLVFACALDFFDGFIFTNRNVISIGAFIPLHNNRSERLAMYRNDRQFNSTVVVISESFDNSCIDCGVCLTNNKLKCIGNRCFGRIEVGITCKECSYVVVTCIKISKHVVNCFALGDNNFVCNCASLVAVVLKGDIYACVLCVFTQFCRCFVVFIRIISPTGNAKVDNAYISGANGYLNGFDCILVVTCCIYECVGDDVCASTYNFEVVIFVVYCSLKGNSNLDVNIVG